MCWPMLTAPAKRRQIAELIRQDKALAAGLRSFPRCEEHLSAEAVVGEGRDLHRLGVHHHHGRRLDRVRGSWNVGEGPIARWLKTLPDVDVPEIALTREIVHGEPLEVSDLLLQGELDGELLVVITVEHVGLARLVWHDESLGVWSAARSGPKESVATVSIVDKVLEEQRVLVNSVNVSAHLRHIVVNEDEYVAI